MKLIQVLIFGVSLGAIYSLLALGFVTIFKGTKVFNLAQGSVMIVGVYVTSLMTDKIGFFAAAAAGVLAAAVLAVILDRVVALAPRGDHLVLTILTVGIDIVLVAETTRLIGTGFITVGDPWGARTIDLLGVTAPVTRLIALAVGIVLIAIFFLVFQKTRFGIQMRASSADSETAALMGISQRTVSMSAWAIGGGLAAVGGIFLAMFPNSGLDASGHLIAFHAIPAVVIGGLDSLGGAVIGGLTVGIVQTLATSYSQELSFLGDGFGDVSPYILMLIFLLVRPSGLFGTKELVRV